MSDEKGLHGAYDETGAKRWCAECEKWVNMVDWMDHRDHGDYRLEFDEGASSGGTDREIAVEMTREEWDVVIHALEEEMAQLVPSGDWVGSAPGEESAAAIGVAHGKITESVLTDNSPGGQP